MLVSLAFAGCLSESEDPIGSTEADGGLAFEPVTKTFPFMATGAATPQDSDPALQSWDFEVPAGATEVFVKGTWSCVSLCPLHVTLTDANGNQVRDQTSGGWSDTYPAVTGTWTLTIQSGRNAGATVGSDGEHVVTVS